MNKGVLQNNSPVQQMMATINPSLWNINNLNKQPFISSSPSNSSSSTITNFLFAPPPYYNNDIINNQNNHSDDDDHNYMNMSTSSSSWLEDDHQPANNVHHDHSRPPPFHDSWSQFLLGGAIMGEAKKMENWEEQVLIHQESSVNSYINTNNNNIFGTNDIQEIQKLVTNNNWSPCQINNIPSSSPQSCVTNAFNNHNNNMLDFNSKCIIDDIHQRHTNNPPPTVANLALEHNKNATSSVALKKPKIQPSSSQSTFKVRKEKLGDRVTALHQLVSPFGKTDTASVLLEAIGYIRFLHGQVEALSLPYLTSGPESMRQPHTVIEGRKCIFPEDPGQLVNNENGLKRKRGLDEDSYEEAKDLRSRGLCLVPLSYTMHVGSDNGADYWAPAIGGSF